MRKLMNKLKKLDKHLVRAEMETDKYPGDGLYKAIRNYCFDTKILVYKLEAKLKRIDNNEEEPIS